MGLGPARSQQDLFCMNILDLVVGKPIKTSDERAQQIGPVQGIPIFGLDGLSSAAYGRKRPSLS